MHAPDDNSIKSSGAHASLAVLAQFCAEYVKTLEGWPATQGAVHIQIRAALDAVERALPIQESPVHGGTDS